MTDLRPLAPPRCPDCGELYVWVECDACLGRGAALDTGGDECEPCWGDGGDLFCSCDDAGAPVTGRGGEDDAPMD